jgi:phosphate starvation-inducible membrane PsiE
MGIDTSAARPVNTRSLLVTLAFICLMSVALYLFFFVVLPPLDRFLALVAPCYHRYSLTYSILGFFSYLE